MDVKLANCANATVYTRRISLFPFYKEHKSTAAHVYAMICFNSVDRTSGVHESRPNKVCGSSRVTRS